MKWFIIIFIFLTSLAHASAEKKAEVMIVGTFHMANPNKDLHNVNSQDVLTEDAQRQLNTISEQLSKFNPTKVMVEWPKQITSERYESYLKGELPESRNEVVQLGFRLAKDNQLQHVIGIDSDGSFPYQQLKEWAEANNKTSILDATNEMGKYITSKIETMQNTKHLSEILSFTSSPDYAAFGQSYYSKMLLIGKDKEQPGAKLVSEWASRNYRICAKLLQNLADGERAIVFYGSGHLYYLRRCVIDTPGVSLVEASDYLGKSEF